MTGSHEVVVSADALERFVGAILGELGAPEHNAARVAASLVESNLAGHDSHGVLLLPYYAELIERGQIRPHEVPETVLDRGGVIVLDGRFGFGQITGMAAADLAIERGRQHGLACVLARNANHVARLGEYSSAVAESGLAAILLVNCQGSGQMLAAFGGTERRLTNNPISIAAPAGTDPVVLDMALSVAAEAKVWLAKARGEPIPEGWALAADGQPTTDPEAALSYGTLLPVGGVEHGHKGYGLIVLVDILVGALSRGGVCHEDSPEDFSNALLLLALDIEPLAPREAYEADVESLRSYVKSGPRLDSVDEILFPGEFEATTARRRRAEGIRIEDSTWTSLLDIARSAGVAPPV